MCFATWKTYTVNILPASQGAFNWALVWQVTFQGITLKADESIV